MWARCKRGGESLIKEQTSKLRLQINSLGNEHQNDVCRLTHWGTNVKMTFAD